MVKCRGGWISFLKLFSSFACLSNLQQRCVKLRKAEVIRCNDAILERWLEADYIDLGLERFLIRKLPDWKLFRVHFLHFAPKAYYGLMDSGRKVAVFVVTRGGF